MIRHETIITDDVDQLFAGSQGWDYEVVQLSPGPLGCRFEMLVMPGVALRWEHWGQRLRNRHRKQMEALSLGLLIAAERAPIWKGCEVRVGQALLFGTDEHEYVSPARMQSLNIEVDADLLASWGLDAAASGLMLLEPSAWHRLLDECRRASALVGGAAQPPDGQLAEILCNRIVTCLVEALGGVTLPASPRTRYSTAHARRFALVKGAESIALAGNRPIDCEQLAADLHTSPRTLHRAIKDWSGLGPQTHFQILRLHRFRRELLQDAEGAQSITAAAHRLGFENLGRLASLYRSYFGELPRETRRRARG